MASDFPQLIGKFIHHCGALKLLTNKAIMRFGNDNLLLDSILKLSFSKRIGVPPNGAGDFIQ